jgi:hypothetical protein
MIVRFAHLAISFNGLLFPAYVHHVWNFAWPCPWGEVAIMLWLVIMGAPGRSA